MSRAKGPIVASLVLALHGLAVAALVSEVPTPPQLESAPPLYGSFVSAPQPEPEPEPVRKKTRAEPPAQTSAPEPLPVEQAPEPAPQSAMQEPAEPAPDVAQVPRENSTPTVIPPKVDASARQNPPPAYPATSRRRGEQGTVVLAIRIDARGRVVEARIQHSSGHRRLDEAALEAVRHWRYQPATRAGVAIAWDYRQPVVFSLSD